MSDFAYAYLLELAMIAVFIALRLRSTLGKQVGFDPREKRESREQLRRSLQAELTKHANAEAPAVEDAWVAALPEGALRTNMEAIRTHEPSFTTASFLEGAKGAFEWIFNAYHKGDRATLKTLLEPAVLAEFEAAITAREDAKHTSKATLVAISEATITEAVLEKRTARVTVRFESEQMVATHDADGVVVEGDAAVAQQVTDEWTFTRELGSRSPNWMVSDT